MTPPSSAHSSEYWAPPRAIWETSFVSSCWSAASAPSPVVITSPMCETSNIPAPLRTASCSAPTPAYWIGISQPAKSAIRAPAATWRS